MTGQIGLTDKQKERKAELEARQFGGGKPLTPNMQDELAEIIRKESERDLSMTCKRELVKSYREFTYDRRDELDTRQTIKGKSVEEDGLTLISLQLGKFFTKNTERVYNDFLSGEYDAYHGRSPYDADVIAEVKCPYSLGNLPSALDLLKRDYYYQVQGYMALSGAKMAIVGHALVNNTLDAVSQLKKQLFFALGGDVYTEESQDYINGCIQIEKNHIFDRGKFLKDYPGYDFSCGPEQWIDIPAPERIFMYDVERNDLVIASIYERVQMCREWMVSNLTNPIRSVRVNYLPKATHEEVHF